MKWAEPLFAAFWAGYSAARSEKGLTMILRGNIFSKTLEMETGLTVVAPNEYREDGGYKVVYLLHGLCGNNASWTDYSMLAAYAAKGSTVYVLPEVARSFYADMKQGFRYFTYVTDELPAICRSLFNISSAREDTGVAGCSMGGYGALRCALSRPEAYGMCAAFSSSCLFLREGMEEMRAKGMGPDILAKYGPQLPTDFACAFGRDLEWSPEIDLLALAGKAKEKGTMPKLYAACGDSDFFRPDNAKFAGEMRQLGFNLAYEEWEGGHSFFFFDQALKKAVEYFGW